MQILCPMVICTVAQIRGLESVTSIIDKKHN